LRLRFEFTDGDFALNVAGGEQGVNLSWSFSDDPGWSPKLMLRMTCGVGNRYLQGRESLAIAIARGQVRHRGESRAAMLYLPAARLFCEPYRQVIQSRYPELTVQGTARLIAKSRKSSPVALTRSPPRRSVKAHK